MKTGEGRPPPATVSLKQVVEEIELLLNEAWTAYLNLRTGETYTVTEEEELHLDEPDDPGLPDWRRKTRAKAREIYDSTDWIALPTKRELGEYDIMARFCECIENEDRREALLDAIHGRGAFQRFKRLVHRYGIQQQWYAFRDREIERTVADWLEAEGIPYAR
jgi:hypothetical protein